MPKAKAQNYEYNLPEGYTMDENLRSKLDALVDEAGMDEVLANRFVTLHVELMEDYAQRVEEATQTIELNRRLAEKHSESTKPQKKAEYAPENPDLNT